MLYEIYRDLGLLRTVAALAAIAGVVYLLIAAPLSGLHALGVSAAPDIMGWSKPSCEEIRAENGPYAYCADDPRKGHRPPLIWGP